VTPVKRTHRLATDDEVLAAVVAVADDGFAPYRELVLRLPRHGEREVRRSVARSARRGLLVERRDADGRRHFALTSEGWRLHRGGVSQFSRESSG
jgi:hypothetical protein